NEACTIIREAAECEDVQINFGVTMNESMADAVKITVIATGFQPHSLAVIEEARAALAPQLVPEPASVAAAPESAPEAEPEPTVFDPEDLDTPAYLRQGRLLN